MNINRAAGLLAILLMASIPPAHAAKTKQCASFGKINGVPTLMVD